MDLTRLPSNTFPTQRLSAVLYGSNTIVLRKQPSIAFISLCSYPCVPLLCLDYTLFSGFESGCAYRNRLVFQILISPPKQLPLPPPSLRYTRAFFL